MVQPIEQARHLKVKVAFDGEVTIMLTLLDFRVLDKHLYLLMPQRNDCGIDTGVRT